MRNKILKYTDENIEEKKHCKALKLFCKKVQETIRNNIPQIIGKIMYSGVLDKDLERYPELKKYIPEKLARNII